MVMDATLPRRNRVPPFASISPMCIAIAIEVHKPAVNLISLLDNQLVSQPN